MPEMIPVGNTIQPPKPIDALGSLSGILGIKQQQQNLQTGQYIQQEQQAGAQQAQQKNQELQNLAAFTHQAINDPSYQLPDGTPDISKYQQGAMAVAPTYGQPVIGQTTSNFKEGVETRKAIQSLSAEQNNQLSGMLKGIASNPNATRSDLVDAIEQQRINNKDPAYNRALDNLLLSSDRTNIPGSAAKAASALGGFSQQAPSTIDTGAAVQPGATNVFSGQFNPAGAAVQKQLTPGERLPHQASTPAGLVNITPQGAISAPPQAGAPPPGVPSLNPSTAQAQSGQALAATDAARYSQISQEGTNATTGAQLADQVSQLAEEVRTGKLSKEWNDRLAVLQQHDPSVTARQMLSKYAAQLKTMATSSATTDQSRTQIDEGMPSPETMNPDATKEAAQYVGGIFRMRGARQANADRFVKTNGNSMGMQATDDAFMQAADPTVFAYQALPAGQERQRFLVSHGLTTPDKQQAFRARLNQVNHYAGQ